MTPVKDQVIISASPSNVVGHMVHVNDFRLELQLCQAIERNGHIARIDLDAEADTI
jgi:hypothetical protein